MTFVDWFPALTMTTVIGAMGWLLAPIYKAMIEKSVQAKFDIDLEKLRAELRTAEAALARAAVERDARISALTGGAMSTANGRFAILDQKGIDALRQIWEAVCAYAPAKSAAMSVSVLKIEALAAEAAKSTADGKRSREFAQKLWEMHNLEELQSNPPKPEKLRPFVPPLVWAKFGAYRAFMSVPILLIAAARAGTDIEFLKRDAMVEMAKLIMPEYSEELDRKGALAIPGLLQPMEDKILDDIRTALASGDYDKQNIERASDIVQAVNAFDAEMSAAEASTVTTTDAPDDLFVSEDNANAARSVKDRNIV